MNLRKNSLQILKNQIFGKYEFSTTAQCAVQRKKPIQVVKARQLESLEQSLSSKGFLRSQKPYEPEGNISERVQQICSSLQIPSKVQHKLSNLEEKFKFLSACFTNFKHDVPNSQVHELQTIGDVIKFYETPVDTTTPYDALKKIDLPENLHIQYDYLRFHPDTDNKFNGQTAFPKSSTLVTGLKYRGKYEGHEAKRSWP